VTEEGKYFAVRPKMYGCKTCSLALKEEHRLGDSENRVLRILIRPKRDEVIGGWKELHNEELRNMYGLPSILRSIQSRRMRWAGHVARMEEE
jgi:hypothetical protein